jgi:hypothetical protein
VLFIGQDTPAVKYEIKVDKQNPVYYNPNGAVDDLRVYKQWRQGLETTYLKEIHCVIGDS